MSSSQSPHESPRSKSRFQKKNVKKFLKSLIFAATDSSGDVDEKRRYKNAKSLYLALACYVLGFQCVETIPVLLTIQNDCSIETLLLMILIATFLTIPLTFASLGFCQYSQKGVWGMYDAAPAWRGIGLAGTFALIISILNTLTIASHQSQYMLHSLKTEIEWMNCDHDQDFKMLACKVFMPRHNLTIFKDCFEKVNRSYCKFKLKWLNPPNYYWQVKMNRQQIPGFQRHYRSRVVGDRIIAMIIVYVLIRNGAQSIEFFSTFLFFVPSIIHGILFVKIWLTTGAFRGLKLLANFRLKNLTDLNFWVIAINGCLLSVGQAYGGLSAFAMRHHFRNPTNAEAVFVNVGTLTYSVFYILMTYGVYGSLSYNLNMEINALRDKKFGFFPNYIHFPIAFSFWSMPNLWSFLFYLANFLVAIRYLAVQCEVVLTMVYEMRPNWRKYSGIIALLFCVTVYAVEEAVYLSRMEGVLSNAFLFVQQGILPLMAFYFAVFLAFFYGVQNFVDDMQFMLGIRPSTVWQISWYLGCLVYFYTFVRSTFILKVLVAQNLLQFNKYFLVSISSLIAATPLIYFVVNVLVRWQRKQPVSKAFHPMKTWGPGTQSLRKSRDMFSSHDMTKEYLYRQQRLKFHTTRSSQRCRKPSLERGTSCIDRVEINSEISSGVSLPYLPTDHHHHHPHQELRENGDQTTSESLLQKYRRRQQSVSSEDGVRPRAPGNGSSFSSSGSGCAKLRRHNACRQKNREATSFLLDRRNDSVRSRSLNHLDTLEMRQGITPTGDSALKDSRSEPDCTGTLPAVPSSVASEACPSPQTCEVPLPHTRRHVLCRSQKSSSECFSVNFEVGDENTWENELFFPAQRGVTLFDSLSKTCESQNVDLSNCDARLQDKENNSETFLSFSQDTAALVGRHIKITAKEAVTKRLSGSIHGTHSRKKSESYKPRTGSFFSSSAEETNPVASSTLSLHEGDQSKKQIKQMFTSFFANSKDSKYEGLIDQLDKYSKQGIPKSHFYQQGICEAVDSLYKLEEDWRDIVEFKDLTEKQQQQQTVLWELIKTEVQYIKMLKVVTDLFLSCLQDLQSRNLLKEIDTDKLFSNITEILDANVQFWKRTLYPLIRDMRRYKRPACIENMLEGFSTLHETFQPYYKYCAEQSRCQHYCRENLDSEVFTAYLTWCESQKDCNRLRLMDILVQPMQRLTKYGLLLKAVLKNTEEDVEKENLQTMIKMVDDFVNNVNSSLKHKQDKERLKGIIARIESYDVVDSRDDDIEKLLKKDKGLTQFDLNRPMLNCPTERKRHLLLEGDLKLKDSGASKMEVHCFLLTDMLLICKPSTKKGGATMRVIRQPYLVDRLIVSELNKETPSLGFIYKNEFDMAVAAFILQNNDSKKIKGWKDGIAKAQTLYAQAKQMSYIEESLDADLNLDNLESDYHCLQLAPRSPLATSSRASRVSSLAHSHSGSVEMNDQSSMGSVKDPGVVKPMEADRTGSISSDEGVQPLPPDKSPVSQKNSFKNRLFSKTPNTLSVQQFNNLGQSLPNLALGSQNVSLSLSLNNQNTLSVPSSKNSGQLLSPTQRGISYPPPSPTRANLRRGLAISQNKNPPLIKTRHLSSSASCSQQVPSTNDFDVPVIAGVSQLDDRCESFSRGQHRQAMKRSYRNDKRYYTAGVVDDIKRDHSRDASIHKRLSWNCNSLEQRPINEDHT